jgi:Sulfotransferase domain
MAVDVAAQTGFPGGLDMTALTKACVARNEAVQAAIPARQLLVYQVKEAWEPLCAFLEVPVPTDPFLRTNDRLEFWAHKAEQMKRPLFALTRRPESTYSAPKLRRVDVAVGGRSLCLTIWAASCLTDPLPSDCKPAVMKPGRRATFSTL